MTLAGEEELVHYLAATLATVLGFGASDMDLTLPIRDYGLDSLTALEFKNRIESDLGVNLPMVRFLQGPSLTELSAEITPLLERTRIAQPDLDLDGEAALLAGLDDLTDTEVEAALAALLEVKGTTLVKALLFIAASTLCWAVMEPLGALAGVSGYQVVWTRYGTHLLLMLAVFAPRHKTGLFRSPSNLRQICRSLLMLGMPLCFLWSAQRCQSRT